MFLTHLPHMAVMLGAGVRQHAAAAKRDHLTARLIALRGRPVRRTCELFDFFEQLERGRLGMTDREKVIKGLECLADRVSGCQSDCPYYASRVVTCFRAMAADALSLLKEQERQIEQLEYHLAITQNNLNYYVNGND